MALGAVLASALNSHASRLYGLYVDGLDVINEPATPSRYAVPMDSIRIEEQGPDDVSSMDFTIECTTAMPITVAEGAFVSLVSIPAGPSYTLFSGFVDHVDIENMAGDVGTRFKVRCTGIEAILDWAVMPSDVTLAAGTTADAAVLALAAQAYGPALGYLRAFGGAGSTNAGPVKNDWSGPGLLNAVTVSAGTTLREGIREVSAQAAPFAGGPCTVDFWGGLRYYDSTGVAEPALQTIDIDDDPPLTGTAVAESLSYGIDAAQYRGVIVKGTGVTAIVGDGSGHAGPVAVLSDSTLTTVAAATAAGTAYLAQYTVDARGSYDLSDSLEWVGMRHIFYAPTTIRDARVGLTGQSFSVNTVAYAFTRGGARTDLHISFGGPAPSMVGLTRQLTRTVLS